MGEYKTELEKAKEKFNEKYSEYSESQLLIEQLYNQAIIKDKTERIRYNTSVLVWFLVVTPICLSILSLIIYALFSSRF